MCNLFHFILFFLLLQMLVHVTTLSLLQDLVDLDEVLSIADLDHLGISVAPNKESGLRIKAWTLLSLINPEETGNYFEGDIMIRPALLRNGVLEDKRWPGGFIPYVIEGNFDEEYLDILKEVMQTYENLTCVRFVPRKGHKNYVAILNEETGCYSYIGKQGGRQEVNFQTPECFVLTGTIIHELMHTIGFMHETARKDRDEYVTIRHRNIKSSGKQEFKKFDSDNFGVPYDYGSVMHYSEYAFNKNGEKTIIPKKKPKGVKLGQRDGLSPGDILKINRMYRCWWNFF